MLDMRFRILLTKDEDGVFIAECPQLPGCISQGRTREEAIINIKDAMSAYVQTLRRRVC